MARSGQGEGLKESAALCILARDCGEALPSFLKSVETLRSSVAGSRVFIVENNSRDSTKEVLKDFAPGDRVVSKRFGAGTVVSAEPGKRDLEVTVDFDYYGRKVLLAGFAAFTREE